PPRDARSAGGPRSMRATAPSSSSAPTRPHRPLGRRGAAMAESARSCSDLASLLLDPAEAERLDAHGRTEAAVLVPMHGWPENPGLVFTERGSDMRLHRGSDYLHCTRL